MRVSLLIELYGIETHTNALLDVSYCLLIELYGIETRCRLHFLLL